MVSVQDIATNNVMSFIRENMDADKTDTRLVNFFKVDNEWFDSGMIVRLFGDQDVISIVLRDGEIVEFSWADGSDYYGDGDFQVVCDLYGKKFVMRGIQGEVQLREEACWKPFVALPARKVVGLDKFVYAIVPVDGNKACGLYMDQVTAEEDLRKHFDKSFEVIQVSGW